MQTFFLITVSILIVLFYILSKKSKFFKTCLTFCVFALYVAYIALRIFSVPIKFGVTSSVLGILLLVAEILGFFAFIVYISIFYNPKKVSIKPISTNNTNLPQVDVLICTYNEPIDIVRLTALGSIGLDYPKELLNVYILDDGHREEFKNLAESLNINYITRPNNKNAKAGNINNALKYIKR